MSITVQFESYEEMVAFANKLVGGKGTPEVIKKQKGNQPVMTEEPLPSESKTSMSNAPEGIDSEEAIAGEEEKTYTLEEVRAVLAVLTRAGKQKQVKDLLTSFNAKNLTSVDPKDYAALMEKAGAL